jgi:hypothetical protein
MSSSRRKPPGGTHPRPPPHLYRRSVFSEQPGRRIGNSPGFSAGKWLDEDGGGRHNTLEVATRGGPPRCRRHWVANNTIVKERACVDNADRNLATTISP